MLDVLTRLDDPHPPAPPPGSLARVQRRAGQIRRRRQAVRLVPVAFAASAIGALALRTGDERPGEVATGVGDAVTTTVPLTVPPDRGEVLEPGVLPEGAVLEDALWLNDPAAGVFERELRYALPDGGWLVISRVEARESHHGRDRARVDHTVVTPGGDEVGVVNLGDGSMTMRWFTQDPNLVLAVTSSVLDLNDLLAIFDGLSYVPPTERCVVGEEVRETGACAPAFVGVDSEGNVVPGTTLVGSSAGG